MHEQNPEAANGLASDEFADLLGALGAETEGALEEVLGSDAAMAREIELARATIDGLRSSLAGLEPLGNELASSEQRRMALEQRNRELETDRRTTAALLAELGRVLHSLADRGAVERRSLRRLANALALPKRDGWEVIADVEGRLGR